jgi:hypothetical protein
MKRYAFFLIALLLLLSASRLSAIKLDRIEVHGGLVWIGNSDELSAPSPLKGISGVSLYLPISDTLLFSPGLDFYTCEYFENPAGKIVPADKEQNDAAGVLGLSLKIPLIYTLGINEALVLHVGGGLNFLFRIPISSALYGDPDVENIQSYFFSDARFLYPETNIGLEWLYGKRTAFIFQLNTLYPIFHWWEDENNPFYDQMMIKLLAGLTIKL